MSRTVDCEALFVEKFTNATNEQYFVVLIISAVAAPLYRFELAKLLLPIPQNVGLDLTKFADLTDSEIAL